MLGLAWAGDPHVVNAVSGEHSVLVRLVWSFFIFLGLAWGASLFLAKLAIEPIKKAWKKQLDFTADASHELRTPLAVIQTSLEIVLDNPEETVESQRQWLENIQIEHARMASLVEDLLTLARGDTSEQVLSLKEIEMNELIKEVKSAFTPLGTTKGITLESREEQEIAFIGDRKRLKQLLVILVDNAIKHMGRAGSITIEISISKGKWNRKKMMSLNVRDTGCGIPEEKLPYLFERFYRADPSRTEEGSGLGLAIAKWIVESHDGSIQVSSKVGEGTNFMISLPFVKEKKS